MKNSICILLSIRRQASVGMYKLVIRASSRVKKKNSQKTGFPTFAKYTEEKKKRKRAANPTVRKLDSKTSSSPDLPDLLIVQNRRRKKPSRPAETLSEGMIAVVRLSFMPMTLNKTARKRLIT